MNATTRTLREPSLTPFQWFGETLYLPEALVEVFGDVVEGLHLAERATPPTADELVEWARTLRLRADQVERRHVGDAQDRAEQACALRRRATVLVHAGVSLLTRRGVTLRVATQAVRAGDVLHVVVGSPLLEAGAWVVEDTLGGVSVTKLDTLGRRTGTSRVWAGRAVEQALQICRDGKPIATAVLKEG